MKTNATNYRTAVIILSVLALLLTGALVLNNRSGRNKLDREKLRSEGLLSEKLDLEQRMDAALKDINSLKGRNESLDKKVAEVNEKLALKEKEVWRLMAESQSLKELKKKNAELEALCSSLESDIHNLNAEMLSLVDEKELLAMQLEDQKTRNNYLVYQNNILEAMLADNFQIEALRGKNEKLTIVAKRANTLVSSFDVPNGMGEDLYFKVITPDKVEISSKESPFASLRIQPYEGQLMASLSGGAATGSTFGNRAELVYKPEQKLKKGVYRFHVYDGENYMGSVQLRLK